MPDLSHFLERLRHVRPPPGPAAGVLTAPSAGDELSREVVFLFGQLEGIARQGDLALSAARSFAAELEAGAREQRRRVLDEARADGEHRAASLLADRRASCEQLARALLADAEREAELTLARGRARTPQLVEKIVGRLLAGPG